MIKSISLENWKSHKLSNLYFGKGTNILVGSVGSGKSSILEGICFALYGTFPDLNSKKISLEETIMNKPQNCDYAKVCLEFELNNSVYRVERTITKGKASEAKLFENNSFLSGPKPRDVNSKILELLELDYELFSRAVYSEQNQIDFFLKLSPSQRKEKIDQLLELDKYEKVRSQTVTLSNRFKKILNDKQKWLDEQEKSLDEVSIKQKEEKLKKKLIEKESLLKKQKELKENLIEAEKELKNLKEKHLKFKEFNEKLIQNKTKIESIEKEISLIEKETNFVVFELKKQSIEEKLSFIEKELKEFKEKQTKIFSLKEKINSLEERAKFFEKQLKEKKQSFPDKVKSREDLEKAFEDLDSNRKTFVEKLNNLKKIQLSFEKDLTELLNKISLTKSILSETEKHLNELNKSHSNCPVCKHSLNEKSKNEIKKEHEATINEKQKTLHEFKDLKEKLEKNLKEVREQIELQENDLMKLKELKLQLENLKPVFRELDSLQENLNKTFEELNKSKEEFNSLSKEFDEKKLKELEEVQEKYNSLLIALKKFEEKQVLENSLKEIQNSISDLNFSEEKLNSVNEFFFKNKSELESLEKELSSLNDYVKELQEVLDFSKKQLQQLNDLREELQAKNILVEKLSFFVNALKNTQIQLRTILIDSINAAIENIWPRIYPYKDFVNAKLEIVNGSYEILVKQKSSTWVRVDGILSGGERSAVALTIRIAISLVLTKNLSWLILDEPTHNLDSKSVSELTNLMKEHLPELVDQIFVITHDKYLEKAATSSLYFLNRDKDNEGITEPELLEIET